VVARGGWVLAAITACGGMRVLGQRTRRATSQCRRWLLRGWNRGGCWWWHCGSGRRTFPPPICAGVGR